MAVATYATRLGGFWLMARLPPSPRVTATLRHVPGAVLAAILAPAVLGSVAKVAAALVAGTVAARTGSILAALTVGVAVVIAVRGVG